MQVEGQGLTDYDIFLFRKFCADGLKGYLRPMRDFWAHASSYKERGPGEHPLMDAEFAGSTGYRVEKRKLKFGNIKGIAAYPFVRMRSLNILPTDGSAKFVLRRAMEEPLQVEEFMCLLDSDKRIAFLTQEAYTASVTGRSIEACVVIERGEAYALLAGQALPRTRRKIMRALDIEEGEWETGGASPDWG